MLRDVRKLLSKPVLLFSRQEAALAAVTFVWGMTFLAVKAVLAVSGPLFFVGARFCCAALAMLILSFRSMGRPSRMEWIAGLQIGLCIFLGYSLQTYGLESIPSSKSAFITALYVPIVPFLQWIVLRRRPHLMSWAGVALAFLGLLLLAGPSGANGGFGPGEAQTALSTLALAGEIILISKYAGRVDLRHVTVIQLAVAGLASFLAMPLMGEAPPSAFSWLFIACAAGLGIASAIIQLTMNWAQKSVSATRATVIYAGEPVWAGLAGRVAGERLPGLAWTGAALIVAGVIVSEMRFKRGEANKA